jgi:hypothetical protein
MMKNLLIVTPTPITKKMVQEFVQERGGYWNDDPTLDQGVIDRQEARVFISYVSDLTIDYAPDELSILEKHLEAKPLSAIDIHIGHGAESEALAQAVSQDIVSRWRGFIDHGMRTLSEPEATD